MDNDTQSRMYATFILRGKQLDPNDVTERLGITPSRSFKRGDRRGEKGKWPFGFWSLESDGQIQSTDLILHIEWLINKLEPSASQIRELVHEQALDARISCLWISPECHHELDIHPRLIRKIADLGLELSFDIYCDL